MNAHNISHLIFNKDSKNEKKKQLQQMAQPNTIIRNLLKIYNILMG